MKYKLKEFEKYLKTAKKERKKRSKYMKNTMQYKVGDKVRVREDLEVGEFYNECYFNSSMVKQIGKVVEIKDVIGHLYLIEDFDYIWTAEMFSGLAEPINLMPLIAKELGVEMGEEFEISNKHYVYKFTEDGLKGNDYGTYYAYMNSTFVELISGKENIIKLPKKPKLTEDERVILSNIPKEYKYMARDKCGALYGYENKPTKEGNGWFNYLYNNLGLLEHLFQFIKWEDKEPYNIEELLKGE